MPRCLNCREKFTPQKFLQKFCGNSSCKIAENEYNDASLKSKNIKLSISKDKNCKGSTEKTKGYGCGKPSKERIFGLGKECKCYTNWLLKSDAGAEYLKRVTLKITAPRVDLEKAIVDNKERVKLTYLLVNVRNIFHEYIRLRDKGKDCICCGVPYNSNFHASHFYKAELYSNLKYDENNVFGGCQKCNLLLEGNESGFRTGLIQRYSIDFVNEIDNKAKSYKKNDFKWERTQLEELRKYYQEKLKSLKNEHKTKP